MNREDTIKQLGGEGWINVDVAEFGPNCELPEHTHDVTTVHVILTGELALSEKDGIHHWKAGDRFEVLRGTTHSGKCGPSGCSFVVGFKQ